MHDPAGTPPKAGFENVAFNSYDLFQPTLEMRIVPDLQFICGNEISWVMENTFTKDGETSLLRSIEVLRFDEDGSVEIRTYYDIPNAAEPVADELFSEYLPRES